MSELITARHMHEEINVWDVVEVSGVVEGSSVVGGCVVGGCVEGG